MNYGSLVDYFTGVAFKRLSATEVDLDTSHGHEFQGVNQFRQLFGDERCELDATIHYLTDDLPDGFLTQQGKLTWYDSRENNADRSAEFRLYYSSGLTVVQNYAQAGDLIVGAKRPDGEIDLLIAKQESTWERQLIWLFGIEEASQDGGFKAKQLENQGELNLGARLVLENLGIELQVDNFNDLEPVIRIFPDGFPTTREFSEYIRKLKPVLDPRDDPDAVLLEWLEREEACFRTLERYLIENRLNEGFNGDVDEFISFSLSVQNRRKSRAGLALENHLEAVFQSTDITYTRTPLTEGRSKPDFIFPGSDDYLNPYFESSRLSMLAVKTTCKDRWRQVLTEADRVSTKHLLTLESPISTGQTDEMMGQSVQLVVPEALQSAYLSAQQDWLMNLAQFTDHILNNQGEFHLSLQVAEEPDNGPPNQ